ncbi:MAG: MFS transporter [Proteobacteria bacterium]|nr:MFS transporter [Pseudomonadota bacterium]
MKKNLSLSLFAIVAGAFFIQVTNGVLGVIVPLHLGLNATPTPLIGMVVTAYAVGFLASCLLTPSLIRHIGHIRAFSALASIQTVSALAFVADDWAFAWAILRFIGGFASAGLYAVIESWVTEEAPKEARGRVLAIYMICNKIGLMLGQGILALGDTSGAGFYMLACGFAAFSIVPVALSTTSGPPTREVETLGIIELYRIAPIGVVGCVGAGLVNSTVLGLLPVYGIQTGVKAAFVPLLVVAAQLGSMFLQWPLGWMSDKTDRRYVIIIATVGSALVALVIALTFKFHIAFILVLFGLWGAFGLSLYSVCVVHASDFAKPSQLVPLVSSMMLAWAVGSAVGPSLATIAMEYFGPRGLMYYAASISMAIGLFAVWRMTRRTAEAEKDRQTFINIPVTTPGVSEMVGKIEAAKRAGKSSG